jgi:hypothetical protein
LTKRKRKVFYPPAKTDTKRPPAPTPDPSADRPSLARINMEAGAGRAGFSVGDRVRIEAGGIYAGELAIIERLSAGAIPSALVRTDGGGTRQVRTIDLAPAPAEPPTRAPEPAPAPDAQS